MDSTTTSYSLTQGANIATFAAALSLILSHPDLTNANNIQILITAVVVLITTAVSFYGRWRKGDLTLSGFRKN